MQGLLLRHLKLDLVYHYQASATDRLLAYRGDTELRSRALQISQGNISLEKITIRIATANRDWERQGGWDIQQGKGRKVCGR